MGGGRDLDIADGLGFGGADFVRFALAITGRLTDRFAVLVADDVTGARGDGRQGERGNKHPERTFYHDPIFLLE